ncbi:MAG: aminotransferase class III-fold pyridoxal phosphate-dependent enzyme [Pseudomonadota bacterium]
MAHEETPDVLFQRRSKVLSPSYYHHYDEPLHAVRAQGVTIWDQAGKAYLDCYNNVPSVGHCHPHVIDALTKQASAINAHSRYLHDTIVTYAERVLETLPAELDMCVFACSGTEANALAYDIARTVTGHRGVIVSEGAYHGNALAVGDFSIYRGGASATPEFARAIPVPPSEETGVDGRAFADQTAPVAADLGRSEFGLAMAMIDSIFDAPGIFTAPSGYLARLAEIVRSQGGLLVMDEVQSGLTRLGDNMWGFMDSGIVPDIVTMGKPMGAGYPLSIVAAKRPIFEAFAETRQYFNTFGGTPVAGAVGNAVLDVIEGENILQSVGQVGRDLTAGFESLRQRFDCLGQARGKGLFHGIEVISDPRSRQPDRMKATEIVNDMRRAGVLISACGMFGNVLKVRPPLVFSQRDADQLLTTLERVLGQNERN